MGYELIIEEAKKYITTHLSESISLKDLADYANMSRFHFHRVFSQIQGETPMKFIMRCRIQKASELIESDSNVFLYEIAEECGFSTQSLFTKAFKKYFDITPHEYKNKVKEFKEK